MRPLSRNAWTFLGGLLGGIIGTSGMFLIGVAAERLATVPLDRTLPQLELGFGGPVAGAGVLGPDLSLPVHYLHGAVLGLLLAGILLLGERWRVAPHIPLWADGLIFGTAVSGFVVLLLDATVPEKLSPELVGLVVLLHVTFGGLAGGVLQRVRDEKSLPSKAPDPVSSTDPSGH
jgi:hypothetical protein